jgi:hypothetical protein
MVLDAARMVQFLRFHVVSMLRYNTIFICDPNINSSDFRSISVLLLHQNTRKEKLAVSFSFIHMCIWEAYTD